MKEGMVYVAKTPGTISGVIGSSPIAIPSFIFLLSCWVKERSYAMKKIVDYDLQQRDEGVGFRLLFDDHTWTDTSYVIPDMKLNHDCDGYSEEEDTIRRLVFELQEHNILTEETFIEAIHKRFGISEKPYMCVATYVEYDMNNKKVLEKEHVIVDGPSDFKAYSLDKEARMKDPSKAVRNVFNEFRYLDEDAKVLYYTYLEMFSNRKEVTK